MYVLLYVKVGFLFIFYVGSEPCFSYINEEDINCKIKPNAKYDKTGARIINGKQLDI